MWGVIRKRAAENRPLWPNAAITQEQIFIIIILLNVHSNIVSCGE